MIHPFGSAQASVSQQHCPYSVYSHSLLQCASFTLPSLRGRPFLSKTVSVGVTLLLGSIVLQKSPCWWYRMCTSNFQICLQRIAKLWNVIVNPQGDTAWQCHKRERAAEPVASFYMHEVATCIGDDPHICLPATSPKWLVGRCEDQSPVNHLSKYHLCQIRIQGHLTHQTNAVQSSLTADGTTASLWIVF